MARSTPQFRVIYVIAKGLLGLFYRLKVTGKENVPDGAAIVYANHCHWTDPVLLAFMLGRKDQICFMAKEELFKNPLVAWIFRAIGCFSVSRGNADTNALGVAEEYLADGRKVGIFPEGTRTREDGSVRPKGGFLRIAAQADVPLLPVYIERERKLFRPTNVVVGQAFSVDEERDAETGRINYPKAARSVMQRVWDLKEKFAATAGKAEEVL